MTKHSLLDEETINLYKTIRKNVKFFRMQKGLTQLELSLAMGYKSVSLVSAAELYTNNKHFNIEHLQKISKILNVPIVAFFEEHN
jgi:putative transcriptional regulator